MKMVFVPVNRTIQHTDKRMKEKNPFNQCKTNSKGATVNSQFHRDQIVEIDKPALLKVISDKWIVHIFKPPLCDVFHGLEQKRLVLSIHILNSLHKTQQSNFKVKNWA